MPSSLGQHLQQVFLTEILQCQFKLFLPKMTLFYGSFHAKAI